MKRAVFFSAVLFFFGCSAPVIYKTAPAELGKAPLDFSVGVAVPDASDAQTIPCFRSQKKLDAWKVGRFLADELKASGLFKTVDLISASARTGSADILVSGKIKTLGFPNWPARQRDTIVMEVEWHASIPSQQLVLWKGRIAKESPIRGSGSIREESISCSEVLQSGFREFRSRLIEAADAYQSGRPLGEEATAPTPSTRQTLENIQKELQE